MIQTLMKEIRSMKSNRPTIVASRGVQSQNHAQQSPNLFSVDHSEEISFSKEELSTVRDIFLENQKLKTENMKLKMNLGSPRSINKENMSNISSSRTSPRYKTRLDTLLGQSNS